MLISAPVATEMSELICRFQADPAAHRAKLEENFFQLAYRAGKSRSYFAGAVGAVSEATIRRCIEAQKGRACAQRDRFARV
jgi:REP element-mobilizing transposase RayT